MDRQDSFYITLISDKSTDLYPSNSQSDFKNKLTKNIQLEKDIWEVALVELIIPSQIINITETNSTFFLVVRDPKYKVLGGSGGISWTDNPVVKFNRYMYVGLMEVFLNTTSNYLQLRTEPVNGRYSNHINIFECKIPEGTYRNIDHLLDTINEVIQTNVGDGLMTLTSNVYNQPYDEGINVKLIYDETFKRVKFITNEKSNIGLAFHQDVCKKMGFEVTNGFYLPDPNTGLDLTDHLYGLFFRKDTFKYGVDLNVDYNNLFIYSDLVTYSIMGDIETPLIRIIGYKSTDQQNYHVEFEKNHYIPLAKSNFDEIEIFIRGVKGDPVHFIKGVSIVKLHFRKRIDL